MKITRYYFHLGPGQFRVNGFIKASLLERIAIRRHWKRKRHNLRPTYNWPGLRQHGASYIIAAKGSPNPDRGPRPGYPVYVEKALKERHSGFELWCVSLGVGMTQHVWWAGMGLCLVGIVLPRLLERQRLKRWGQG